MRNMYYVSIRGAERSFNYNAAIITAAAASRKNVAHRTVNNDLPSSGEAHRLPKLRLMLLFETLLVRGGYNSGVALKWPRVQQPSSISNILQGSEIRLLVFFPHSALTVPILPFTLFLLIPHFSLSFSFHLSIRLSMSLSFAVASSQSSFMPPGGEDLITHGEWILPVLSVPKVRAAA